jgi:hypothetical protein
VLEAWQGMWMSILFFLPIAIVLIIQATTDSSLMDMDSYLARIARFKTKGLLFARKRKLQNEDSSVNQ